MVTFPVNILLSFLILRIGAVTIEETNNYTSSSQIESHQQTSNLPDLNENIENAETTPNLEFHLDKTIDKKTGHIFVKVEDCLEFEAAIKLIIQYPGNQNRESSKEFELKTKEGVINQSGKCLNSKNINSIAIKTDLDWKLAFIFTKDSLKYQISRIDMEYYVDEISFPNVADVFKGAHKIFIEKSSLFPTQLSKSCKLDRQVVLKLGEHETLVFDFYHGQAFKNGVSMEPDGLCEEGDLDSFQFNRNRSVILSPVSRSDQVEETVAKDEKVVDKYVNAINQQNFLDDECQKLGILMNIFITFPSKDNTIFQERSDLTDARYSGTCNSTLNSLEIVLKNGWLFTISYLKDFDQEKNLKVSKLTLRYSLSETNIDEMFKGLRTVSINSNGSLNSSLCHGKNLIIVDEHVSFEIDYNRGWPFEPLEIDAAVKCPEDAGNQYRKLGLLIGLGFLILMIIFIANRLFSERSGFERVPSIFHKTSINFSL